MSLSVVRRIMQTEYGVMHNGPNLWREICMKIETERYLFLLSVLQLKQGKSHFLSRARTREPLNISVKPQMYTRSPFILSSLQLKHPLHNGT